MFSNVKTISPKSFREIFLATCLCKSGFAELEINSDFSWQPLILLAPQTISAIEILIKTISCNGKLGFGKECNCIYIDLQQVYLLQSEALKYLLSCLFASTFAHKAVFSTDIIC